MSSSRQTPLMRRVAIVLGLLLPSLEQVSDAFVFGVPASKLAACRENGATACSMASRFAASCQLRPPDTSGERRTEELHRQRYRGQVSCRATTCSMASRFAASCQLRPSDTSGERRTEELHRQRYRGQTRTRRVGPAAVPLRSGMGASEGGGPDQSPGEDGDMGMAPVDLDQAMGSFSPEWGNDTVRDDPKKHLIKGSVIAADQTVFAYPIDSFPPLANSEVYYNGTAERYWWNQNSDAVCVYVPVAEGFDPKTVEFTAKTKKLSLKFGGEEVLSGTLFYRIDGYESLYVVDSQNDPPYVQLELFKVREFQNWEDLIIEKSGFSPGGAQ